MYNSIVDDGQPRFEKEQRVERGEHRIDRRLSGDDFIHRTISKTYRVTIRTVELFGKQSSRGDVF